MAKISCREAVQITRDIFQVMDWQVAEHCERTAYILYKILQFQQKYQGRDLAGLTVGAMFHDVGALRTKEKNNCFRFEFEQPWIHSIHGFLALKYLSPLDGYADPVLYHHMPYNGTKTQSHPYHDAIVFLNLAEQLELYLRLGRAAELRQFTNRPYSRYALRLFDGANRRWNVVASLGSGSYRAELDQAVSLLGRSERMAEGFLELLLYLMDFRSERTFARSLNARSIASGLARRMNLDQKEIDSLYYASMVYDLGMLALPQTLIDAPCRLTNKERRLMENHVRIIERILKPLVAPEITEIAVRHHEKLDGTGYLNGLRREQLSPAQRILALSDTIAALHSDRPWQKAVSRRKAVQFLKEEAKRGKTCPVVTEYALNAYDDLMARCGRDCREAVERYENIKNAYEKNVRVFDRAFSRDEAPMMQ